MPEYKGGLRQLEKELNDALTFDNKINSKIYLSIYINCEDKAYGFQVIKSINSETDNRIITQLKQMQNWSTGKQRGVKIDCKKSIGIILKNGKIIIE